MSYVLNALKKAEQSRSTPSGTHTGGSTGAPGRDKRLHALLWTAGLLVIVGLGLGLGLDWSADSRKETVHEPEWSAKPLPVVAVQPPPAPPAAGDRERPP